MEKISVCLRVRPFSQKEQLDNDPFCWDVGENKIQISKACIGQLISQKKVMQNISYEFNQCFAPSCNNYEIFETCVKDIITHGMMGINGTLFMYGQTGSGKTFTMLGNTRICKEEELIQCFKKQVYNDIGVLVFGMMEIFKQINKDSNRQFEIRCSYYEIYNESVFDLLRDENVSESLLFGTDHRKEFVIKGLKEISVVSLEEVFKLISKGETNRHYAETILNHQSSRSHTIFKVLLNAQSENESTEACINFIDLAGSEKISQIQDDQTVKQLRDRSKESSSINKSLFFLTRVIALKTQKIPPQHIPFRNSTLTKLIKTSLTGNFKTLIILTINPSLAQYDQTNSTLRFGLSAKLVEQRFEQNLVLEGQKGHEQLLRKLKNQEKTIEEQQLIIQQLKQQNSEIVGRIAYNDTTIDDKHQSEVSDYSDILKEQLQMEIDKNTQLNNNCEELKKRLLKANEQILTYFNSHIQLQERVTELKLKNEKLQKLTQQALNRLDCYENAPKVVKFQNHELDDLEKVLEHNLMIIRKEKETRYFSLSNQDYSESRIIQDSSQKSENTTLHTQPSQEIRNFTIEEEELPRTLKNTPIKESNKVETRHLRISSKQTSYFNKNQQTNNTSSSIKQLPQQQNIVKSTSVHKTAKSKSPLKKTTGTKRGSDSKYMGHQDSFDQNSQLQKAKQLAKQMLEDEKMHNDQQFEIFDQRSKSNDYTKPDQEQQALEKSMMSLADRLNSLSEKFSLKTTDQSFNRYSLNKSEIILETESELLDSIGASRATLRKSIK